VARFICSDQSFSRTGAVSSFDSSGAGASSAGALLADKKLRLLSISGAKWSQARSIFRQASLISGKIAVVAANALSAACCSQYAVLLLARGVIEIFASIGVSIRNPSSVIATGFLDYDEPGMLSGHSDFKSLTLRYKWALCHGRAFVRSLPARAFRKRGRRGLPDRRSWPPTSMDLIFAL
jgi:hypothetical protein